MTREEEIRNTIDMIILISHLNNKRTFEQELMAAGFEAGVKWADANPKSLWISVKEDLPCNHEELLNVKYKTKKVLILKCGGFPDIDYMLKINGKWEWSTYKHPKFWLPIPELSKE